MTTVHRPYDLGQYVGDLMRETSTRKKPFRAKATLLASAALATLTKGSTDVG